MLELFAPNTVFVGYEHLHWLAYAIDKQLFAPNTESNSSSPILSRRCRL